MIVLSNITVTVKKIQLCLNTNKLMCACDSNFVGKNV